MFMFKNYLGAACALLLVSAIAVNARAELRPLSTMGWVFAFQKTDCPPGYPICAVIMVDASARDNLMRTVNHELIISLADHGDADYQYLLGGAKGLNCADIVLTVDKHSGGANNSIFIGCKPTRREDRFWMHNIDRYHGYIILIYRPL
jgi:hypothetical protein